MGRADAAGCAEHPWARVRVTRDGVARDAIVVGTHLGPLGHHLKTQAMGELASRSREVAGPDTLVVLSTAHDGHQPHPQLLHHRAH